LKRLKVRKMIRRVVAVFFPSQRQPQRRRFTGSRGGLWQMFTTSLPLTRL
jgi:hypothetical protein